MPAFGRQSKSVNAQWFFITIGFYRSSKDLKATTNHIKELLSAHWSALSAERNQCEMIFVYIFKNFIINFYVTLWIAEKSHKNLIWNLKLSNK